MANNLINIGRRHGLHGDNMMILRTASELFLAMQSDNLDARILLIRIYMHFRVNLEEVSVLVQLFKCK